MINKLKKYFFFIATLLISALFYLQIHKKNQLKHLSITSPNRQIPTFKVNGIPFKQFTMSQQKYVFLHFSNLKNQFDQQTFSNLTNTFSNQKFIICVISPQSIQSPQINLTKNTFTIIDTKNKLLKTFKIRTTPETILIAPNGTIISIYSANQDWKSLLKILL